MRKVKNMESERKVQTELNLFKCEAIDQNKTSKAHFSVQTR